MQKDCKNDGNSIYKSCRKSAARYNDKLNSREGASELLNISESSLRNYELMLTPVPVDVVVRMADLYGAPELEACYCKNDCPIGKRSNISTKIKSIEQITCSLLNHADADRMMRIKRKLLEIADGKLEPGEEEALKEIVGDLSQLADDAVQLSMYLKKHGVFIVELIDRLRKTLATEYGIHNDRELAEAMEKQKGIDIGIFVSSCGMEGKNAKAVS